MNKEEILLEALNIFGNFTTVKQEFNDNQLEVIYEAMELVKNNAALPNVSNRTWIVTIECGDNITDWKIAAPNKLAAKITAGANYNGKQHNILRCVEYGC